MNLFTNFMLQPVATNAVCSASTGFGGGDADWLTINILVILMMFLIASAIYTIANFLPTRESNRYKGFAKYEYIQLIISVGIIVMLIGLSSIACNYSVAVTGQSPFVFAQGYIENLLFIKGTAIVSNMYAVTVGFMVAGQTLAGIGQTLLNVQQIAQALSTSVSPVSVSVTPGAELSLIYTTYAEMVVGIFTPIVTATFGMLFVQWITLPIIAGIGLAVIVPTALIIRSLGFMGPKVRESADTFLALAIAFYFIFPMTFVMDQQIVNWTFCTGTLPQGIACNPYVGYTSGYNLQSVAGSVLFNSMPITVSSGSYSSSQYAIPLSFYGSYLVDIPNGMGSAFLGFLNAPGVITNIVLTVADYVFQGIVLIALNLALTIGLAVGLSKGLTTALTFIQGGSLWN